MRPGASWCVARCRPVRSTMTCHRAVNTAGDVLAGFHSGTRVTATRCRQVPMCSGHHPDRRGADQPDPRVRRGRSGSGRHHHQQGDRGSCQRDLRGGRNQQHRDRDHAGGDGCRPGDHARMIRREIPPRASIPSPPAARRPTSSRWTTSDPERQQHQGPRHAARGHEVPLGAGDNGFTCSQTSSGVVDCIGGSLPGTFAEFYADLGGSRRPSPSSCSPGHRRHDAQRGARRSRQPITEVNEHNNLAFHGRHRRQRPATTTWAPSTSSRSTRRSSRPPRRRGGDQRHPDLQPARLEPGHRPGQQRRGPGRLAGGTRFISATDVTTLDRSRRSSSAPMTAAPRVGPSPASAATSAAR